MLAALDIKQGLTLTVLSALILLGLGVAAFLTAGLFEARSLIRREFSAYFLSPIAYVVLVVFLAATGLLFYLTVGLLTAKGPNGVEFPMQMMLGDDRFWLVFLFIPPLLTMRLFAEERSTGTLEMLMTAPLRDWQVVLSKYVACFGFYILLWLPTLLYLPVLLDWQAAAWEPVWTVWSWLLLGGLAGMVVAVLSLLLGSTAREIPLVVLVTGLVCVGVGAVVLFLPMLLDLQASLLGPFGTVGGLLLLGGLVGMVVAVLSLLGSLGSTARVIPLVVLVTGLVCVGVGAVGYYRFDSEHLLEITGNPDIDPRPILSSYLGLALVGAMFLALGLFISSLVRSQMVAAILSLAIVSLVFIAPGILADFLRSSLDTGSWSYQLLYFFSVPLHFSRDFSRGIVDTRHLVLYSSVAVGCLFLTVRSLESRRWR